MNPEQFVEWLSNEPIGGYSNAVVLAKVQELVESSRQGLYEAIEIKEGEPVQYLGVYVLDWRAEWGQPAIGFREAPESPKETE